MFAFGNKLRPHWFWNVNSLHHRFLVNLQSHEPSSFMLGEYAGADFSINFKE